MFSDQHIALMRKFKDGAKWYPFKDLEMDAAMHYLIEQRVIAADFTRGDRNTFFLTEHGKSTLYNITEQQREKDFQKAKAETDEAKRAEERRQDKADSERQNIASSKAAKIASVLSAITDCGLSNLISLLRSLFS